MRARPDRVQVFLVALVAVVRYATNANFQRGFRVRIGHRTKLAQHLLIMLPHAAVRHIELGFAHQSQPGVVIAKDLALLVEDDHGRGQRIEQRGLACIFSTGRGDLFGRLLGTEAHVEVHQYRDDTQHRQVLKAPQLPGDHQTDREQQRENPEQMTKRQARKESQCATLWFGCRMQCVGLS